MIVITDKHGDRWAFSPSSVSMVATDVCKREVHVLVVNGGGYVIEFDNLTLMEAAFNEISVGA